VGKLNEAKKVKAKQDSNEDEVEDSPFLLSI
jgi:hypothetical protein